MGYGENSHTLGKNRLEFNREVVACARARCTEWGLLRLCTVHVNESRSGTAIKAYLLICMFQDTYIKVLILQAFFLVPNTQTARCVHRLSEFT